MIKKLLSLLILLQCSFNFAQEYFPKNDGVVATNTNYTAFTNAKIYVTPTQIIEKGTLLIKDGKVVSSGKSVNIPKNSTIVDLEGKSIYPSFIDLYSDFGIDKPKREGGGRSSQYDPSRTGFYWNDHIMPEANAVEHFKFDSKKAEELRKAGFGVVNTHLQDGIIRGSGVLIALNAEDGNEARVIDPASAQYLSFSKSVASNQSYPTSLMGAMALLRQVYIDADWYAKGNAETTDLSLEALNENKNLVQIFEAGSRANVLRADKVGDQFNIQYVILGGGDEYERVNEIKQTNAPLILPVDFPDAYDVDNPFLTASLSLEDMRSWNQMPANPKILADNGVKFAFTTHELKSPKEFGGKIQKAIEYGLSETKALEALTTVPAEILGKANEIGSLKPGAYANFVITSGPIFDSKTTMYENWVQGNRLIIENMMTKDIKGEYEFTLNGQKYNMTIEGPSGKVKSKIKTPNNSLGSTINYDGDWVYVAMTTKDTTSTEFIRLVTHVNDDNKLVGKAIMPDGREMPVSLQRTSEAKDKSGNNKGKDKDSESPKIQPITYPNLAYGFKELPKPQTLLFKNATVWTNEDEGILENTDVLIKGGKIAKVGKNLSEGGATVIDATGKHLTPGIIDEHSHIAAAAINEAGHNSSAEVTIEDVVEADDLNIYRNLGGGVTSIQILHGSANPIGGRSAIIKLKWGQPADELIYDNSPKFIKFALGENVKQANWNGTRFPQSRMGVEQLYVDYFTRAREYNDLVASGKPYRRDIELEVLGEILKGERFITAHSYVQSEINMLMKVAERFGFNINTFTHILEGYKLAEQMKEHGVGGSTFSDWWAYKYEVNDAIPYNAAIMHEAGVTVAINSDDSEMSRRLNQEAAKSVKYGGISEEDALKFVTLNPAKLLHIDDRVGSIKVGKDGDVVLWTDHPLSIYAKAEKTIIEGVTYFDLERDKKLREEIQSEKSKLVNDMLAAKNKGLKTKPIEKKEDEQMHCDTGAQ
ncbi:MAG: amidohydrolase family protein [Flavobacteriaceae bacterium]|nr:amidohydrolase family protein [Flavobacteriaceae bacterium]